MIPVISSMTLLFNNVEKKRISPRTQHSSNKSSRQYGKETGQAESTGRYATTKQQHHKRHSQAGSGINAQNRRTCQRILESCLQHQSTNSQRTPAEQCCHGLRQTSFPHDKTPTCLPAFTSKKYMKDIGYGNRNRSHQQISNRPAMQLLFLIRYHIFLLYSFNLQK